MTAASRLGQRLRRAALGILLPAGIGCGGTQQEPQRPAIWGDALPLATHVVYGEPTHPPVVVELLGDGSVRVDPQQVWLEDDSQLVRSGMKAGMQEVTLDELNVSLVCARDKYVLRSRMEGHPEAALEGPERVSTRGVLMRVHKETPWQNVAWVAMIAGEARMWKLEFEVRNGAGMAARFLAHEPSDPKGRPSTWDATDPYAFRAAKFEIEPNVEIEVAMVDGSPSWTVNGAACAGVDDARSRLTQVADRRSMPTMVRIGFSVPAGVGVGALDFVRSLGFERVWWAVNVPHRQVRNVKKLPPPE